MSSQWNIGDTVPVRIAFTNRASGTPFDPNTLSFKVESPAGVETEYANGAGEIVWDEVGQYHVNVLVDESGVWRFWWTSTTDTDSDVTEGVFRVRVTGTVGEPTVTLQEVVDAVSKVLGMEEGEATGGSTTTVVDPERMEADWATGWVYIKETTDGLSPEGEERRVSSHAKATGTMTVARAYGAAVGIGDVYQARKRESRATIVSAINDAIQEAYPDFYERVIDESTLVIVSSQYIYQLPPGLLDLYRVWARSDTTSPWDEIDTFSVSEGESGIKYIHLPENESYTAGQALRLLYTRRCEELEDPDDTTIIPLIWLKWQVLANIHNTRAQDAPARGAHDKEMYSIYQKRAEVAKAALKFRGDGWMIRQVRME